MHYLGFSSCGVGLWKFLVEFKYELRLANHMAESLPMLGMDCSSQFLASFFNTSLAFSCLV